MQNAGVLRQTLIAVADSHSFRVADLNERAPRYKWRRLIENFFGKLKEFKRIALRADKTDASFSAIVQFAAHSSSRDESQQALGEKALCADLRPYAARSIDDRYLRI